METQNYNNHIRWYKPHHFVFYPVMLVAMGISIRNLFHYEHQQMIWLFITGMIAAIIWLSFMLRQHYALINQNRIVRLELRFRYYVLSGKRLEPVEQQLSFGQLAALRFASDEELVALTDRAVQEQLSPDAIKKSVKNWLPDYMRV